MMFLTFAFVLSIKVALRKLAGIEFEFPLALLALVVAAVAGWMVTPGKHSVSAFGSLGGIHMQRWGGDRYPEVARHAVAAR